MSYGESWVDWSLPEEEAIKQVKTAYELGINVSPMRSSGVGVSGFLTYCVQTFDTGSSTIDFKLEALVVS
jgi:hypothetical protein